MKYHVSPSLSNQRHKYLVEVLNANGAVAAPTIKEATHVITDSLAFDGWQDVPASVPVISVSNVKHCAIVRYSLRYQEKWVIRSITLNKQQECVLLYSKLTLSDKPTQHRPLLRRPRKHFLRGRVMCDRRSSRLLHLRSRAFQLR